MRVDEYRRLHSMCLDMAKQPSAPEVRTRWLVMAAQCMKLATQAAEREQTVERLPGQSRLVAGHARPGIASVMAAFLSGASWHHSHALARMTVFADRSRPVDVGTCRAVSASAAVGVGSSASIGAMARARLTAASWPIELIEANNARDQLPKLAAGLLHRGVDVIVAPASPQTSLAAKSDTTTIPIVFSTSAQQ